MTKTTDTARSQSFRKARQTTTSGLRASMDNMPFPNRRRPDVQELTGDVEKARKALTPKPTDGAPRWSLINWMGSRPRD